MSVFGALALGGQILGAASAVAQNIKQAAQSEDKPSFADDLSSTQKFMDYQKLTPAQKIRASFLAAHGLTEDQLKGLPAEERTKIEKAILEEIMQKLGVKEIRKGNIG